MLKRCMTAVPLLGAIATATIGVASPASAYLYVKPAGHDCGKATLIGGFGGPRPSNVPLNAVPQVDTFVDRGTISCATARRVMSEFEKSAIQPGANGKGVSPAGWKCAFSASLKGQSCKNGKHVVISNGIVYVTPKK